MFNAIHCLVIEHDLRLVFLAGVICFLASVATVSLFHRARAARGRIAALWTIMAGTAAGCGVWATHFIAMLAYSPGVAVGFGSVLTAASFAAATIISASGLAVAVASRSRASALVGGMLIGVGVACMHYLGMLAIEVPARLNWSAELIAASVIFGLAFGALSMLVATRGDTPGLTVGAAVLLTSVTVVHHFIGMAALTITPDPTRLIDGFILSPDTLAFSIAGAAASILGMGLIAGLSDRRAQALVSGRNDLMEAALDNMSQGLMVLAADATIVLLNRRYCEMYNLAPDALKPGCSLRDLVERRMAAGSFYHDDPEAFISGVLDAIAARTPRVKIRETSDGRVICVSEQVMANGGWVITHDDITMRRRAEEELESTRNFLDTVVEHVPAVIVVKRADDLSYVLINRAYEQLYGVKGDDFVGKTAHAIFPKENADRITAYDHEALQGSGLHVNREHPVQTQDNETRIVTTTRLPILGPDGTPQYLVLVIQDVTERKRAEARIAHLALHDSLTDLPNRAAFGECFATTMERAKRLGETFAVLCLDLDRFKEINDVFGHSVGDELLREMSKRLTKAADGAVVARLGGDEFAVIALEGDQPGSAAALAERLLAAMASEFVIDDQLLRVGMSIGVAIYPTDGTDAASLLGNADAALYRAKAEGRGSLRFFEADMDRRLRDRRALVQDLRSAIAHDELRVHYQPQASIEGAIMGFEALLRWEHPERGSIPPNSFIPLAEESGLILPIGEWVLREACREAASWAVPLSVAINLSTVQFRHGDLPGLIHSVLLETGLPPSRLELEITESVLIDDLSRAVSILRRLKTLGVRIAMDDFGTGYSSLSNLQAFPFDRIKIDRSFIANLKRNAQSATIVRAVIGLGRGLSLPVIAEGVETEEQRAFLESELCAEIQGYLIGKPLPIQSYRDIVDGIAMAPDEKVQVA